MPMHVPVALLRFALCLLALAPGLRAEDPKWPDVPYSYVKGYFYYPADGNDQSILEDGRLHAAIENVVPLTDADVAQLRKAIVPTKPIESIAKCYMPHHAFIFFDGLHRKPVAHLEICFLCEKTRSSIPLPRKKEWDLQALEALCKKLKLPVPGDPEFKAICDAQDQAFEKTRKDPRTTPPRTDR